MRNAGQTFLTRKTMHTRKRRDVVFRRTVIVFPAGPFPAIRCGAQTASNGIVVEILCGLDTVFNGDEIAVMARSFLPETETHMARTILNCEFG